MRIDDYPNLARSGQQVLEHAAETARQEGRNYIFVEHLLKSLSCEEEEVLDELLKSLGVDKSRFGAVVDERIEQLPKYGGHGVKISEEVIDTLKRALGRARATSRDSIEALDLLSVLPQDETGSFTRIFSDLGASRAEVLETLRTAIDLCERREGSLPLSTQFGETQGPAEESGVPVPAYKTGEMVRIKRGAFQSMTGRVHKFYDDKSVIVITVNIFNGQRLIELNYKDVEKLVFAEE